MRTLLIGVLAATLVGCSYPLSPQASMEACADPNGFGGLNKMTGSRPAEPAPASSRNRSATAKVKSATATKTEERSTAAVRDRPQLAEKKPTSTVIEAKVEDPASGRPAETSDPIIVKAKTTIAAKLEDPASVEFGEMKRAIRKSTSGSPSTPFAAASKERRRRSKMRRLAVSDLVTEDEAYVVNGPASSAAASAYRNICSETGTTGPLPRSVTTDQRSPENVPANERKSRAMSRSAAIRCEVWGSLCSMENGNQNWWMTKHDSEFGDIMDDFTNARNAQVTQKSPVLVIIEQHVLARTCILNILRRELTGFEIVEMATTSGLSWFSGEIFAWSTEYRGQVPR